MDRGAACSRQARQRRCLQSAHRRRRLAGVVRARSWPVMRRRGLSARVFCQQRQLRRSRRRGPTQRRQALGSALRRLRSHTAPACLAAQCQLRMQQRSTSWSRTPPRPLPRTRHAIPAAPCPCRRRAAGWKAAPQDQPRHAALMSGEAQAPLQPSLAHAGRPYRSAELNAVGACSAWLLPHTASDADLGAAADAQRHALGDTVTGVTADTTTDTHRHAQAKRPVAAEVCVAATGSGCSAVELCMCACICI